MVAVTYIVKNFFHLLYGLGVSLLDSVCWNKIVQLNLSLFVWRLSNNKITTKVKLFKRDTLNLDS